MTDEIIFYHNPQSRSQMVRWMIETASIIAYLAYTYPQAGLAPAPGEPARGAYYRWLFFGAGCFEPALIDKMMKRPEVERKAAVGWGSYDDVSIQFLFEGQVRSTIDVKLDKGGQRSRTWRSAALGKPGKWDIKVVRGAKEMASAQVTVEP